MRATIRIVGEIFSAEGWQIWSLDLTKRDEDELQREMAFGRTELEAARIIFGGPRHRVEEVLHRSYHPAGDGRVVDHWYAPGRGGLRLHINYPHGRGADA